MTLSFFPAAAAQDDDPRLGECRRHAAAALHALGDNELAGAFKAFGKAADLSPGIHAEEETGLSAAAGGIYRALMQKSTFEQYDLLYEWTTPTDSRKSVRLLTTLVPQERPPEVFARALGERPRETSFSVAGINGIPGLFCSGWLLIAAADDVGRLRTLTAELETLAADGVPNAEFLLQLARLYDARGDLSAHAKLLAERVSRLRKSAAKPGGPPAENKTPRVRLAADVVLAAAALKHAALRPICEEMFGLLVEQTYDGSAEDLQPFLRVAHATAVQWNRGRSGPEVLHQNQLKYWVPVSGKTSAANVRGAVEGMWLVHEDHILHLAGAGDDVLFFRYPLTGDFTFTCETQEGGRMGTDGGLVYGGLHFEALGRGDRFTVWDADLAHPRAKPCPFVRHEDRPTFHRVSIISQDDRVRFAANLHPMWTDGRATHRSPWLGLRSHAGRRPIFRNLKLTGRPVIPDEVRLSEGDELRGWESAFFDERRPAFAPASEVPRTLPSIRGTPSVGLTAPPEFDWFLHGGVIFAPQQEAAENENPQSLLRYERPLLDDELITYEFFHSTGEFEVHPALGRLAFLIEPDGVRIHWITDGGHEWTGLPADNAVLEPLNRRGPRSLPLKQNDWNLAGLAREHGKVILSLNGTVIYERPVDFGGDHKFGFFRDRTAVAAKVRNVVMTGDWPDSPPEEFLRNPAATVGQIGSTSVNQAAGRTVGETLIAGNVHEIRRRAAGLPPAERFQFLADWVLPGDSHAALRLSGRFTQNDPSPIAAAYEGGILQDASRVEEASRGRGGEIVSPVFDLLDVAAELGRLGELRERTLQRPDAENEFNRRARAAMLLLLNLELGNQQAASKAADELYALVQKAQPRQIEEMWPEMLVVSRGVRRFGVNPAVADLLTGLYATRADRPALKDNSVWQTHIASLFGRQKYLQEGGMPGSLEKPLGLRNWVPLKQSSAWTRGKGLPHPTWLFDPEGTARRVVQISILRHLPGHRSGYVFFRSPLRGNFSVEGEIGSALSTQFFAAGKYFGPRWSGGELEVGTFSRGSTVEEVDPPLTRLDEWVRFRVLFRDGKRTVFLNGRPVHTEELTEHHDPWIGVRSWGRNFARIRDVRITGNPQIPAAVEMSASRKLTGWITYHLETLGSDTAIWQHVEDPETTGQILGRRRPELAGTHCESLLRYHRPLVEDGAIEYDFYYEPGQAHAHPALDRLAFLLDPEGVRIHWITDGRFGPGQIPPDNLFDEPQNRRGPQRLPLTAGDWNHLKLSLRGETASLELNGQAIYERKLEPTNHRTFGLFHYADRTELRVRNVVMRGEWPKTLPPLAEQELADPVPTSLDADLPKLTSVFTHDFAEGGLPQKYFEKRPWDERSQISARPDGLLMVRPGVGKWSVVAVTLRFGALGDFDLEAAFEKLQLQSDVNANIIFRTRLDDERQHYCRVARSLNRRGDHNVDPALTALREDGRVYDGSPKSCDATAGKLRLARRGDTVYYLLAEHDSDVFRLLRTEKLSDAPILQDGIELMAFCNGTGETRVLWKNVTLRAEQLKYLPPQDNAPN